MEQKPPKGRPLLILATTSERTVLQQLQLVFKAQIAVPNLQTQEELAIVMRESGQFDEEGIRRAIQEIEATTGGKGVGVGISQIILAVQTAMQDEDRAGRFAEVMGEAVAEGRYA
jgi:vesicle-fusing ATPase